MCMLRHLIHPTPQQGTSHQTLLSEQKTLVVCWHVHLAEERHLKSSRSEKDKKEKRKCVGCLKQLFTYYLLQE